MTKPKPLASQPTAVPTRKMMVFAVTALVIAAVLQMTDQLAAQSEWFRWLSGEAAKTNIPIVIGFGIAYIFRDRAN